jgi:hypothetical protein
MRRRVEHWRAQPEVGRFRSPLFRLRSGCLVHPSPTVPAAPPLKCRTVGFPQYGCKRRSHTVRSAACRRDTPRLRPLPAMPAASRAFAAAFGTGDQQQGSPPLCADLCRRSSPLSPAVLAPAGFGCPCLPRLATSSARLETSGSFPSLAGSRGSRWHSRIRLPGLHTCRPFPAVLSRTALFSFRLESGTCTPMLPYQRWPSGRGKKPLAPPMLPQSASRGDPMSTAGSFALATALLVARLLGCSDRADAQPASGFSIRASSPQVTPSTAG